MNSSRLSIDLRIDWSDIDSYNHVNNIAYMRYMQSARVSFWELSGLYQMHLQENKGSILVSAHCDYKHPLFYPGNVKIETKVVYIGNTSFSFEHSLYNDQDILCAIGKDTSLCYDFNTNQKFSIPNHLRKLLERYS